MEHASIPGLVVDRRRHASLLLNELQAFVVVRENVAFDVGDCAGCILVHIDADRDCIGIRGRGSARKSGEGDQSRQSLDAVSEGRIVIEGEGYLRLYRASLRSWDLAWGVLGGSAFSKGFDDSSLSN